MTFTAKDKLDAVDREVRYRVRVYARLIEQGKMTKEKADREVAIMRAIADDYHTQALKERLL
jgi:hypothetical protein